MSVPSSTPNCPAFEKTDVVYENPLAQPSDVENFIREGTPVVSFPMGAMRLENGMDPSKGQASNYLFWCPEIFPSDISVSWTFRPIREPGLAMFWIAANGREGKDLFDPSLAERTGQYRQYFDGDINAYHLSYFRRKQEDERQFHTCNLRKSKGFHLVCQGADPMPDAVEVVKPFIIEVVKCAGWLTFSIDGLPIYQWFDDGETYGPVLGEGRIGFRQMSPLIADYADLKVHQVKKA